MYNIHLYYILNDGSQVGVGGTTTTLEFRNAKTKTQTYITNVNSEAGSYTVVVDQAPQGRQIKNIRVAVWSESNQGTFLGTIRHLLEHILKSMFRLLIIRISSVTIRLMFM